MLDMYIMPSNTTEYARSYRLANKEKAAEYDRVYKLENHESVMIKQWRNRGHFIPEGTEHDAYVRFRDTTHCEFCNWELVSGGRTRSNTKVRHHDHTIEGEDNFIAVVCHICNTRERCDNTSGEPNIAYHKARGKWMVHVTCFGKKYQKSGFKTFEEALTHKAEWFSLNSPQAFHDPSWTSVSP